MGLRKLRAALLGTASFHAVLIRQLGIDPRRATYMRKVRPPAQPGPAAA